MPGIQGTEVLAQSRELYPLAGRVMLTAYSDIDAAIRGHQRRASRSLSLEACGLRPDECLYPVIDELLDVASLIPS